MPDRMEERLKRMGAKTDGPNVKKAVEKLIDKGMPKKVAEKAAEKKAAGAGAGGAPRTKSALDSQRRYGKATAKKGAKR